MQRSKVKPSTIITMLELFVMSVCAGETDYET